MHTDALRYVDSFLVTVEETSHSDHAALKEKALLSFKFAKSEHTSNESKN